MHLDVDRLRTLSRNDSRHYKRYPIFKKSGGYRIIEQPTRELKAVQAWILRNILDKLHPSSNATAYIKGVNLLRNVIPHSANRYFLCLDIKDFFTSIPYFEVCKIFLLIGYSGKVSSFLSKLCTTRGHLPQGGVTSPALSNLTTTKLDRRIQGLCSRSNVTFTRYADDLTMASNHPEVLKGLIPTALKVLRSEGFEHNQNKLRLLGPNNSCKVTGLLKNSSEPKFGIGNKKKKRMRCIMHRLVIKGLVDETYPTESSIEGWLNFVKGVDRPSYDSMKQYWERLKLKPLVN